MKKALAILMIFALVASVAVAEITLSGWGRGLFVPVANTGASGVDSQAGNVKSWSGFSDPRIKFSVNGNSDNVGFQFEINADGGAVGQDDQQKIWVKPIDMVTITMGQFFDDTLRGNAAFGSFNWWRAYGAGVGEDVTFTRFCSGDDTFSSQYGVPSTKNYNSEQGFMVAVKPMDALFIGVAFCGLDGGILSEDLFDGVQIGAGYTIEGIGMIRAQYMSQYFVDGTDIVADGVVEVAFKFTMIENLYADVGFRMFTNSDAMNTNNRKDFSLYANYKVAGATIHALGIYILDDDDGAMHLGAGVEYDVAGVSLEADFRYENDIWAGGDDNRITFFAGVKKGFSNGLIGAGLEIANAADMGYAIPIRMEYWF